MPTEFDILGIWPQFGCTGSSGSPVTPQCPEILVLEIKSRSQPSGRNQLQTIKKVNPSERRAKVSFPP